MTRWTLRPARPEDAAQIARHRYPGELGGPPAMYAAWLAGAFSDGRYSGLLACHRERVIGGAGLLRLEWGPTCQHDGALRGRLVNVFVEPQFRRRGVARQLAAGLREVARQEGLGFMGLGTTPAARGLYASLGFQASESEMQLRLEP